MLTTMKPAPASSPLPPRSGPSNLPLWWQGATASASLHALVVALVFAAGYWQGADLKDPVTPYPPERDFASITIPAARSGGEESAGLEWSPQVQAAQSEVLAPATTELQRPITHNPADLPAAAASSIADQAQRSTAPRRAERLAATTAADPQAAIDQQLVAMENVGAMSRASAGVDTKITPRVLINPAPRYPADALSRRLSGVVLLQVAVDAQGAAAKVRLVRSSGVPSLDQAALEAVRKWRFLPARDPSTPLRRVNIPVEFVLQSR